MVEIIFLGLDSFLIKSPGAKRAKTRVIINPNFKDFKDQPSSLKADLIINQRTLSLDKIRGEPFVIEGPGEYEVKGVFVQGVAQKPAPIFVIYGDQITICHLNSLEQAELDPQTLERIGNVDVLLVPVGGDLGPEGAAEVISQIEPKIAVPMKYKDSNVKRDLGDLEDFLETMGIEEKESEPKLNISIGKLPDQMEVVVLESKY